MLLSSHTLLVGIPERLTELVNLLAHGFLIDNVIFIIYVFSTAVGPVLTARFIIMNEQGGSETDGKWLLINSDALNRRIPY